ncbi:8-oxo-dGTP diphosphatase / 2-hydroxy-dATP diphosphatase [Sarotherodon galilaeus]
MLLTVKLRGDGSRNSGPVLGGYILPCVLGEYVLTENVSTYSRTWALINGQSGSAVSSSEGRGSHSTDAESGAIGQEGGLTAVLHHKSSERLSQAVAQCAVGKKESPGSVKRRKTVMALNSGFLKGFVHSLTDNSIILADCRPLRYILECSGMRQDIDCAANPTHPDKLEWTTRVIIAVGLLSVIFIIIIVVMLWCFYKKKCSVTTPKAALYTPAPTV